MTDYNDLILFVSSKQQNLHLKLKLNEGNYPMKMVTPLKRKCKRANIIAIQKLTEILQLVSSRQCFDLLKDSIESAALFTVLSRIENTYTLARRSKV